MTKSIEDYIPCIAWGRNARFCENVAVGTEVRIVGRVQSREYEKKHEDGTVEKIDYDEEAIFILFDSMQTPRAIALRAAKKLEKIQDKIERFS